jgi:hypothetical protein
MRGLLLCSMLLYAPGMSRDALPVVLDLYPDRCYNVLVSRVVDAADQDLPLLVATQCHTCDGGYENVRSSTYPLYVCHSSVSRYRGGR